MTKQLNLIASVSRVDAEYTKDNDGMKGRHPIGISPLTASTWLDYKMPDESALRGLGFGVGVRYVRSSPGTSTSYREFDVPSYSVYDGMISYDLERSPLAIKGVRVQANVENIDDNVTSAAAPVFGNALTDRAGRSPQTLPMTGKQRNSPSNSICPRHAIQLKLGAENTSSS